MNRSPIRLQRCQGFSLVELLVVIGMIALLISMLLPALAKARLRGQATVCQSNMRQIGVALMIYAQNNRGWIFPVGPLKDGKPTTLGTNVLAGYRWPVYVFNLTYTDVNVCPSPAIMHCPSDDPLSDHSYVLNQHLSDNDVLFNTSFAAGLYDTQIIVMGEKKPEFPDYYLEVGDFDRLADSYRHGLMYGSNYLFLDWHVSAQTPEEAKNALDPWDVPVKTPTTNP